jgi:hypothetical protein
MLRANVGHVPFDGLPDRPLRHDAVTTTYKLAFALDGPGISLPFEPECRGLRMESPASYLDAPHSSPFLDARQTLTRTGRARIAAAAC